MTTDFDIALSRPSSDTEISISNSKPANQAVTPPPKSSILAEKAAAPPTTTGQPSSAPSDPERMTASPPPQTTTTAVNLKVLKASTGSEIINRKPAGVGGSFPASIERVYVWNQIEAKQIPSEIRHIYYFKGRKISDVTLSVRSSNWRTWSYKSIANDRFRGQWHVDIASADGEVLRRLYFEIR
jgi:hypothetical protein